jgi:hypothetical protein
VQDRLPIAQIWYAPLSSTKLSIRALPVVTRYSGRHGVPTVSPPPAVTLGPVCWAPSNTLWATRKPTPLVFSVNVVVLVVSRHGYGSGFDVRVFRKYANVRDAVWQLKCEVDALSSVIT